MDCASPTAKPAPRRRHVMTVVDAPSSPLATDPDMPPLAEVAHDVDEPRPLRIRVRKVEAAYLEAIADGRKTFEVTQVRYLGGSAHGWRLGSACEPEGKLWVGLSPTGRQASGHFEVTHFCCLSACDALDGVSSWADVSQLAGAGISRAQALARDGSVRLRLDPLRPVYAWRIRAQSVYRLRRPAPIEAFHGPWAETSLAAALDDMPEDMQKHAVLTLVPLKATKATKRAVEQPLLERAADAADAADADAAAADGAKRSKCHAARRCSSKRADPWDHERTALAMSVSAVANAAERTHETSSGSDSEDLDFSGLTETDDEDDALVRFKTPPLKADYRRANVKHRDWE